MGQQEYIRQDGRIHHRIEVPGLIWTGECRIRVSVYGPMNCLRAPHVVVAVQSAELSLNLPTMSPDTARQIGRLLLAAADDADSTVETSAGIEPC